MWPYLASVVDFFHAVFMVAFVAGLPLLFLPRFRRAATIFAAYALVFVVVSQGSHYLLGECFLTSLSRWFWERGGSPPRTAPEEWFTVRFALMVFRMAPSHKAITWISEALIVVTAVGVLVFLRRKRRDSLSPEPHQLALLSEPRWHRSTEG